MRRTARTTYLAGLICVLTPLACSRDTLVTSTTRIEGSPDSTDTTPVATPVPHFNLTVTAVGTGPGSDTTEVTPVPGAMLTLTRIATTAGDTVTTDTDAGRAVADAAGQVVFVAVPTGYFYLLRSVPPSGSPYQASDFRFAPSPYSSLVTIMAWMHRPR